MRAGVLILFCLMVSWQLGCGGDVNVTSGADAAAGGTTSTTSGASGATGGTTSASSGTMGGTSGATGGSSTTENDCPGGGLAGGPVGPGGNCPDGCGLDFNCCDGACRNLDNDPFNCGACGSVCLGPHAVCAGGMCKAAECPDGCCAPGETCCYDHCCAPGTMCCLVYTLQDSYIACTEIDDGTCPKGCPGCVCAAADTPIATPDGERAIATLRVGDLVYSVDDRSTVVVPVVAVNRARVTDHVMIEARLSTGAVIELSPGHPTADGRLFGDLQPGDRLGDARVVAVARVPYSAPFTYDILPGSATGFYFAGGALVGSTLAPQKPR